MSNEGWIGVDLDSTLAHYDHWRGVDHIGAPIPAMVARVQGWLKEGKRVRIFTARVSPQRDPKETNRAVLAIERWSLEHIGVVLPVTCVKDFGMECLYDDRAVQVEKNTGALAVFETPPCPACGECALCTAKQGDTVLGLMCFLCKAMFVQTS